MIFINKLLGKIFFIFTIIFFITLRKIIKKSMVDVINLEKKQIDNKMFINDICKNFFLEKILNLKEFTNNLFKSRINMENSLLIKKYNSLALGSIKGNLLCAITCSIMLFIIFLIPMEMSMRLSSFHLTERFFNNFNDIPDKIIPLLNNIGRIKENISILYMASEEIKEYFNEKIDNIKINIISNLTYEIKKGLYVIGGILLFYLLIILVPIKS